MGLTNLPVRLFSFSYSSFKQQCLVRILKITSYLVDFKFYIKAQIVKLDYNSTFWTLLVN